MSKRDKDKNEPPNKPAEPDVKTGGWDDSKVKIRSRTFPGPAGASEVLRVAMDKQTYAELASHAKESVDREICGVLLGELCEDEYGLFVSVEASIRGTAAKTGGTHVTFTQETWNEIHKQKDQSHPKLQIVGWYHSHPGFGVEFSDMDLFIQQNFFSGTGQIAFVSDPLGGGEAICANTSSGIKNIRRFWVDGREHRCFVPNDAADENGDEAKSAGGTGAAANSGGITALTRIVHELEDRVRQLTDASEKQRTSYYNFLTFIGMLVTITFLLGLGYSIYRNYTRPLKMPEIMEQSPAKITVMIDGKPTLLTMLPVKWELPPELDAVLVPRTELMKMQATLKDLQEAATQAAANTSQPATAPATGPAH